MSAGILQVQCRAMRTRALQIWWTLKLRDKAILAWPGPHTVVNWPRHQVAGSLDMQQKRQIARQRAPLQPDKHGCSLGPSAWEAGSGPHESAKSSGNELQGAHHKVLLAKAGEAASLLHGQDLPLRGAGHLTNTHDVHLAQRVSLLHNDFACRQVQLLVLTVAQRTSCSGSPPPSQ